MDDLKIYETFVRGNINENEIIQIKIFTHKNIGENVIKQINDMPLFQVEKLGKANGWQILKDNNQ